MSKRKKTKKSKRSGGGRSNITDKKIEEINKALERKFRNDIRGPHSHGQDAESVVVNKSIPIVVAADPNKFGAVLLGVISTAISKGWSINTPDDSYIYWAWVYQSELLIQAAKGGIPYTGNVPRWLNILVQAIIKTSVSTAGGQYSYNFDVLGPFDNGFEQAMGPLVYKNVFNMGIKTSSMINGFPVMASPGTYTVEDGEKATQNLWLFLQGHSSGHPMHEMVPFNTENSMTGDASAYSFFLNNPGGGQSNGGAFFKSLYLEVGIRHPLFGVFSPMTNKPFVNRAPVKLKLGACDGITLGAMLMGELYPRQLKMNNPVRPVFVDFMEFVNVYALTCAKAIALRVQTAAFVENIKNDSDYYTTDVQCPLTVLEFTLAIRAALMLVFTDTIKLQGIYPRVPVNGTDKEFVTLNCGVPTAPIPMDNMMLFPSLMKENILALRSRTNFFKTNNPKMYKTCLGMYHGDRLNPDDYTVTYTVDDTTVTQPVFAVVAGEVDIDPVDGAYGMGIAAINEPATITELSKVFNQWVQQMGDHFRKLDVLTVDDGIDALAMVGFYSHWSTLGREAQALNKRGKNVVEEKDDKKEEKKRPISRFRESQYSYNTIYHTRSLLAYTVAHEVISSFWSNIQQFWVTGVNLVDAPEFEFGDNTGFNRVAAFMEETRQIDVGTGSVVFTTLGDRHENYANLMIKTKFAFTTTQEALLEDINNKGESGILGKMLSTVGANAVKSGVDVAADILGDAFPL